MFVLVPTEGFGDFSKSSVPSRQVAQDMVLFAFTVPLMTPVNAVLFSAQSRAKRKMHIWLVHHNQALRLCSLAKGWLPSVSHVLRVD